MPLKLTDYEILGIKGEGYFAIIQRGRHRRTGEIIAIKRLREACRYNQEYQKRLRREIQLLQRMIDVDEVVPLIAHTEDLCGADIAYAMPLATSNVHEFVRKRNDALSLNQRWTIFERIVRAVEIAHDRGILHRDISPSNVLLLNDADLDSVVVSDFGLGRDIESVSARTGRSTREYGHAYYVAPEQREQLREATVRSDVFSMGKLLSFIMTGKDPDHLHAGAFSPVIRRATDEDPSQRYETMSHFADHARRIAEMLFSPDEHDDDWTATVLETVGDEPNWDRVHQSLIMPKYDGHPYYGYIDPVIEFFLEASRIQAYYDAVGQDLDRFVRCFIRVMTECLGTVGWPFRRMNDFTELLHQVFKVVQNPTVRAQCLIGMWDIAYLCDQWSSQRTMRSILTSGAVSEDEAAELAAYIVENRIAIRDEDLLVAEVPRTIRRAIRNVTDES